MGNNRSRTEKQREGNTGAGGLSPLALWAVAAGAAFQLAVFRQIGTEGGVSYASPCLAYGVLLLLSAFGVPEAVAGITAAKRRKGRRSEASALFWSALVLAFLAGGVLAAAPLGLVETGSPHILAAPWRRRCGEFWRRLPG